MPYKDKEKQKEYQRNHAIEQKDKYRKRHKVQWNEMKDYVNKKKNVPCMDCNISYPHFVMDFDHRDPKTKSMNVSAFGDHLSYKKLDEEIAKCDLVCANCHRIRTHGKKGMNIDN
jgi:hypothetical protein